MFWPLIVAGPLPQSSSAGSGSPSIAPPVIPLVPAGPAPCVLPEIRLIAPGVEGPNVEPKKLSLMVKFCARFHSPVTVVPSK